MHDSNGCPADSQLEKLESGDNRAMKPQGRSERIRTAIIHQWSGRSFGVRSTAERFLVLVALTSSATTALAQSVFVDDAQRTVTLPASVGRPFAAGAPAEVLLYTIAPEKLVGRNRIPEGDAVEFFPPAFRNPVFIRQLPEVDNPAADAELVALKPDLYVDYGTVHADYIAAVEAVQKRTGVRWNHPGR